MRAVAMRVAASVQATAGGGEGVPVVGFVAGGDGADGAVEQGDLGFEGVAEQAGDAQGDVHAGAVERREGQDFDAGDAVGAVVPDGAGAEQDQGEAEVLAAGAQAGAAPEVEQDFARVFAVVLAVAAQQVFGGALGQADGGAGGHGAGVDGGEVAAGGQHVGAAARGGAGGAGGDEAAVQRGEEGGVFGFGGAVEAVGQEGGGRLGLAAWRLASREVRASGRGDGRRCAGRRGFAGL